MGFWPKGEKTERTSQHRQGPQTDVDKLQQEAFQEGPCFSLSILWVVIPVPFHPYLLPCFPILLWNFLIWSLLMSYSSSHCHRNRKQDKGNQSKGWWQYTLFSIACIIIYDLLYKMCCYILMYIDFGLVVENKHIPYLEVTLLL